MDQQRERLTERFEHFSQRVTHATGRPWAFLLALMVVLSWRVTGPLFGFADTWQLVINTGTTIVTFLMVFLIQQTQNKDSKAMELKLNELVAATRGGKQPPDRRRGALRGRARCSPQPLQTAGRAGQKGPKPHRIAFGRGGRETSRRQDAARGVTFGAGSRRR